MKAGWQEADATHDCSLSDGEQTFFFNVAGKPKIFQEEPTVPSTFVASASGKQFGDWEPGFSQIEQRDWTGGRGQEDFYTDESRYFDAKMAWTMSPGRLGPVPAWMFAEIMKLGYTNLPGAMRPGNGYDVRWRKMLSGHVLARSFTTDASTYTATKVQIWVRRKGMPSSTLTVKIYADSSSAPDSGGALLASATLTAASLADTLTYLYEFDLGAGFAVSATTTYWICIYPDATDTEINHWEVGYGSGAADTCKSSADSMTSWDTTGEQLYFRITAAPVKRQWHQFDLDGVRYAVDEKASGAASTLLINGWRGKATAGTSTTLTDSNQAWVADKLIGAWVRIWKGTGAGQYRQITDNTDTKLTVATWDITPDTTSEYYVYATNEWRDITPSGGGDLIDGVVKSVAVFDNIAIFAQGSGVNMLKMRFNAAAATPAHEFDDDGTNKADLVMSCHHPTMGPVIYRALNTDKTVKYSKVKAWSTDLSFTEERDVGDEQFAITGLMFYNGQPWPLKENGVFYIVGERAQQVELGFDSMTNWYNGVASKVWNMQAYFNWAGSLMEMYGSSVNDTGPWLNAGLPTSRRGFISCLDATHAFLIAGIDAGDGTSSVLTYNKRGWMELWRAWTASKRVQSVKWQSCPGTWDRLWISVGGDLVCQLFPEHTLNPFRETDFPFFHEWVIETSTIDMKAARISKLFNSLALTSKNLGRTAWIELDFQVDDQIDGDEWISIGEFRESDYQEVFLGQGDKKRIRYRLRGYSEDAEAPALVYAAVLDAFARTPVKFQWIMRIHLKSLAYEGGDFSADPDDFREWLAVASTTAKELRLRAPVKHMDNIDVVIEPPRTSIRMIDRLKGIWTGTTTLVIRQK